MQENGRLLEEKTLGNGLTVRFFDCSRSIVGGRSQVQLRVSIPLAVKPAHFRDAPDGAHAAFTAANGHQVDFARDMVRNFIAAEEVPTVIEAMKREFLDSCQVYLSKPNFAERFIRKRYEEWARQEQLEQTYRAALRDDNEP